MNRLIDTNAQNWQAVRPELTRGVSGKLLHMDTPRMVLTRVEPGGAFPPHRDAYAHLFHFLSGTGEAQVGGQRLAVGPGICLQVDAGELHGYVNNGREDLLLLSLNLAPG